jgi:hypothetical protein
MYTIEMAETRAGRETVVVKQGTRRVCSASLDFVRWMHDRVPTKQLRDEQKALVNWYAKKESQATLKTATVKTDPLDHYPYSHPQVDRFKIQLSVGKVIPHSGENAIQ